MGSDTEMGTFNCDLEGGRRNGICLGNGDNFGAICVQGCNTANDCNPGNACLPLGMTAGLYSGYCLGICDITMSDPMDEIWNCRSGEACDMNPVTATNPDPTGTCRVPCTMDSQCDMGLGEVCEPESAPGAIRFCRVPDQVCGTDALDADCYLGQACDLLAYEGNLGLCVDRCTVDSECSAITAGDVCDEPRGLCRTPCTTAAPCTTMGETCLAGFCEQLTM
jgi:hypothetical protein